MAIVVLTIHNMDYRSQFKHLAAVFNTVEPHLATMPEITDKYGRKSHHSLFNLTAGTAIIKSISVYPRQVYMKIDVDGEIYTVKYATKNLF